MAQTEVYVEYSRAGKIIKGAEKPAVCSRYEEDVLINNHTAVWGSYWKDGQWGFHCCYSLIQNSYCTGQSGKLVAAETSTPVIKAIAPPSSFSAQTNTHKNSDNDDDDDDDDDDDGFDFKKAAKQVEQKTAEELQEEKEEREKSEKRRQKKRDRKKKRVERKKRKERKKKRSKSSSSSSSSDSSSSDDEEDDPKKKLAKALKREEERQKKADLLLSLDERKRPYHSMKAVNDKAPDDMELEAYYMKRARAEDPMAAFM